MPILKIMKNDPRAIMPTKAHPSDACYDLYPLEPTTIDPNGIKVVSTGLIFDIPIGYKVSVYPRSGLSSKNITIANAPGTVDANYRGEIKVILHNENVKEITLPKEKAIAQFALEKLLDYDVEEVESIDLNTDRGSNGFGSSDKK